MEETKTSFIDDEIFFYSSISNYGVCSKHLKSPKNIHMSYSPLSCNQRITFSNTIMIPYTTLWFADGLRWSDGRLYGYAR